MRWQSISVEPEVFGWYPVFAPSADPDKPLRVIAFWNGEAWEGLVPLWLAEITHWLPWPSDPEDK